MQLLSREASGLVANFLLHGTRPIALLAASSTQLGPQRLPDGTTNHSGVGHLVELERSDAGSEAHSIHGLAGRAGS